MSNIQRIKIPRTPDRSIIECFEKIGDKYGVSTFSISALGFSQIGNVDFKGKGNEEFNALVAHDSSLMATCSININGLTIIYYRGGSNQENKSPVFDEIQLNWNAKGTLSNTDKLDIVTIINNELKAFEPGKFIETGLSEEQSQLLSIHEGTLTRLERLNEDLIRQSSEFRKTLEKKFEEKATDLEDQTRTIQDELSKDYQKRTEVLDKKDQTLTDKLKAIDDRDNTHVRREIRDRMLSDVKSRIQSFGLSDKTEGKRTPVLIGIVLMVFAIASLLIYSLFQLNQLTTPIPQISPNSSGGIDMSNLYWVWMKITFLSIGLLGTILYYIKWQNRWAEQHANSEFQLQQFYIDVNRANWVIESCLEWKKETDSEIPTVLLGSITRKLFENGQDDLEKVIHPSDELASALLGSASKLKMKVGDSELEFDKPGKIKSTTINKSRS